MSEEKVIYLSRSDKCTHNVDFMIFLFSSKSTYMESMYKRLIYVHNY